jgi:Flp pilus assembly protein TadD
MAGHPGSPRLLEHLESNAQDDPWVHLFLAWSHARRGQRSSAAERFARAVETSPELARAHYERGRFHSEIQRNDRLAREAFGRYLRLEPTGERADRARERR